MALPPNKHGCLWNALMACFCASIPVKNYPNYCGHCSYKGPHIRLLLDSFRLHRTDKTRGTARLTPAVDKYTSLNDQIIFTFVKPTEMAWFQAMKQYTLCQNPLNTAKKCKRPIL